MKDYGVHRPGRIRDIDDGWMQLSMSVILQARFDLSKNTLRVCDCDCRMWECVPNFYDSDWFNYLCDVAEVDAERTRDLL